MIASGVLAALSTIRGTSVSSIDNLHGIPIETIATSRGSTIRGCPAYYADSNVTFSWNGDHNSGTKYGCKSDGSTILGTGSLTPNTSYGEAGSYGVSLDGTNSIVFATSGDAQIDNDIGTVWIRFWYTATTNASTLFEGSVDGTQADSFAVVKIASTDQIAGFWELDGSPVSAYGNGVPTSGWYDIAYSWNWSTTITHSGWGLDATGWEEDAAETAGQLANFDEIVIGENNYNLNAPTGVIYIDRIAILSTYQAAKPTNW